MKHFRRKIKIPKEQKPVSFTVHEILDFVVETGRIQHYGKYNLSSSFKTFQLLMTVGFEGSETYH